MTGQGNPRWRGGSAEYPKHSYLKRQRLKKLQETEGKCVVCGEKAVRVHHIDNDKSNHDLSNLAPLCLKCFAAVDYAGLKRTSKYKTRYGFTLAEMSRRCAMSCTAIIKRLSHLDGKFHGEALIAELKRMPTDRGSKYRLRYGMTGAEMSLLTGYGVQTVYLCLRDPNRRPGFLRRVRMLKHKQEALDGIGNPPPHAGSRATEKARGVP